MTIKCEAYFVTIAQPKRLAPRYIAANRLYTGEAENTQTEIQIDVPSEGINYSSAYWVFRSPTPGRNRSWSFGGHDNDLCGKHTFIDGIFSNLRGSQSHVFVEWLHPIFASKVREGEFYYDDEGLRVRVTSIADMHFHQRAA